MTVPLRLRAALLAAGLLLAGAATAVASVAVHDRLWGLPLAVLASLAGLLALPAGWGTRLPFAAGWTVVVALAARGRPEGDTPVDGDASGWLLLLLAAALPLVATATARSPGWLGRSRGDARARRGPLPGRRGRGT